MTVNNTITHMLLNQFSSPQGGYPVNVASIDDLDLLQSRLQTSNDARERNTIRGAIQKLREQQAESAPQRTSWKRRSRRHEKSVVMENNSMNAHMDLTEADLKRRGSNSIDQPQTTFQHSQTHDVQNHDSVFSSGYDRDKSSSPFVRDSVSRRNRRSRKSTTSSQSSSALDAPLEVISTISSLPESDDRHFQATTNKQNKYSNTPKLRIANNFTANAQNQQGTVVVRDDFTAAAEGNLHRRDPYRRSNNSEKPGCNSSSAATNRFSITEDRNSVATPYGKQSEYDTSKTPSLISPLQVASTKSGKTSVTFVQGATCKYKTISTRFESPSRLNYGGDSVISQQSYSSGCSSTFEDSYSRTASITSAASSNSNYRTQPDSESHKQSARIKLIALGRKLFSGNSKSPARVGQNSHLSYEGKIGHNYNTCGSREEGEQQRSPRSLQSNWRSEQKSVQPPPPTSSTSLSSSQRNDSRCTAYHTPTSNSPRNRNSVGLGSKPRSTMTECAKDRQLLSHEGGTKVTLDQDRDDFERTQESPIEELEKLLRVYKDPNHVEKIRHTIEILKKSLQEDEESKRSVPDIGGESATLDVRSGASTTSYVNFQQYPTEPNTTPSSTGNKGQEKASEFKATPGFLSTPLSSFVGRSESLRSPKPTYQPTAHAVSRANSVKLSRPKDFISKTTPASSPFLKVYNSNSDKNLTRSQSLYSKTSPASFLASKGQVGSSLAAPDIVTYTRSAVTRSESCKENPRGETRPIPIVQGNVRRSKSILSRILGQKIDVEKATPQEPIEVRSIYCVGKEPVIFPPKSVRIETTSPLKSQVTPNYQSLLENTLVDSQFGKGEDKEGESFQESDSNSVSLALQVENDSDFEKEELVENVSVSSKSTSTSSEKSTNSSSSSFTGNTYEIGEETTTFSSKKENRFHSKAIDFEDISDDFAQEKNSDDTHTKLAGYRNSSLSSLPQSHCSSEDGELSPISVASDNVLQTSVVKGSIAVFEVEIVKQIVSTESESEDSFEEYQEEEEEGAMDRYSSRVIKSRVNVRSQILATEEGNLNNNVSPSKTVGDRRKVPLTAGDDVKSRIQKYKGKLGGEPKVSPTKRGRKIIAEETGNKNGKEKKENIEIIRDSDVTVVTITTTAPAAEPIYSHRDVKLHDDNARTRASKDNGSGTTSSGENGSKSTNLSTSSQEYDSERPRRSRRRKEVLVEASHQSKMPDVDFKTGASKLEEASVVSISELKQHGEIAIKTKSSRQRDVARSQVISTAEEIVPSVASSENTLDAVEDSLSNWSKRRRKKRGKNVDESSTGTSSENGATGELIAQDNGSSTDNALSSPVHDIEPSLSSNTATSSKNETPNYFDESTTLTVDALDVRSTANGKDALNEQKTSSTESEEFYDAEDDTYANASIQDETALVKDDAEAETEEISIDGKGEMNDEHDLFSRGGGAQFQSKVSDYQEEDSLSEKRDDELFEKALADNDEQKDNTLCLQDYNDMNRSEKKEPSDKYICDDALLNVETVIKVSSGSNSFYENAVDKPTDTQVMTVIEKEAEHQVSKTKSRVSSRGKSEIEQETEDKADRKPEEEPSAPPRRHRRHRKEPKEDGEKVENEKPKSSRRHHRERIENEDITAPLDKSKGKHRKEDFADEKKNSDKKESEEDIVDKPRRHHKGRKNQNKEKDSSGVDDGLGSVEKITVCKDDAVAIDANTELSLSEHKNTKSITKTKKSRKEIAEEVKLAEKTAEVEPALKGEAHLEEKKELRKEKENTKVLEGTDSNRNVSESTQIQSETAKEPENMRSPLDNVEEITDQKLLEKMLDNSEVYEDRKRIRRVLRELKKGNKPTPPVADMRTPRLTGTVTPYSHLKSQSRNGVLPGDNVKGSISVLTSVTHTTGTDSWKKTTSITAERTMTSGSKKVGSIFDREDAVRTAPRTSGFADVERRQMERKRELQRNKSMPAASSKDARRAFVAKLEAGSGQKPGKKVGRSPTFVVPNANNVKQMLLKWCQSKTRGYDHVDIVNFSGSWASGMAFCALVHNFFPEAFNYDELDPKNRAHNFDLAFKTADEHGDIPMLLDTEDMVGMAEPDWKCVYTYIGEFYKRIRDLGLL